MCGSGQTGHAGAWDEQCEVQRSPRRNPTVTLPLTIDTHAHYFPESYLKLIADHGQRCGTTVTVDSSGARFIQVGLLLRTGPITRQFTDLEDRLATMDRMGVRMHALSLTQPMVY